MERHHGAVPVQPVGCLQPVQWDAVRRHPAVEYVKRQYLFYSLHVLQLTDKFRLHVSVGKAVKFSSCKDIAYIRCDKIADNRDGSHCGDTDKEQRDILRCIFIVPHIPGGQPAFISQESAKEWCKCRRTEVGKRGNEQHGCCDHSKEREAAGRIPHRA